MADKILTFNGKTISGPSGTGIAIVRGPATMTVRFKFYYETNYPYSPLNEQWIKGNWTFIESDTIDEENSYSIWDWTYTGANVSNAFYNKFNDDSDWRLDNTEILNLTCTSEITDVSNLFNGCTRIDGSCYNLYTILSNMNVRHTDCFKFFGLSLTYFADLARIPEDWGGMKPLQGNGIKLGDYIWDYGCIYTVDIPGLVELDENEDYEVGAIGYLEKPDAEGNYNKYFTPAAIQYMIDHPDILPTGWHVPTFAEAKSAEELFDIASINPILSTTGNNGFNVIVDDYEGYGNEYIPDGEGCLKFDDYDIGWYYEIDILSRPDDTYHDRLTYMLDGGLMDIWVRYGGSISVHESSTIEGTGYLYPVRLVRDHD